MKKGELFCDAVTYVSLIGVGMFYHHSTIVHMQVPVGYLIVIQREHERKAQQYKKMFNFSGSDYYWILVIF